MSTELTPAMRRSVLIAALRDPSMWPEGFEWDFTDCETCAVGLYRRLMRLESTDWRGKESTSDNMARLLSMPERNAAAVFVSHYGQELYQFVTPAMVADRLQKIHEELEGVS